MTGDFDIERDKPAIPLWAIAPILIALPLVVSVDLIQSAWRKPKPRGRES